MHDPGHAPFLLDLYRDDETLATDGDQFILHRTAFSQPAEIAAQGFLNRAPLFLYVATDASQFRRGTVLQSPVGLNLVAERTEKVGEIRNRIRKSGDCGPWRSHGRRRAQRDLSPFSGTVHDQNDVADFSSLEGDAGDARLFHERDNVEQAREFEASSNTTELTDLDGQLLLLLDPGS